MYQGPKFGNSISKQVKNLSLIKVQYSKRMINYLC